MTPRSPDRRPWPVALEELERRRARQLRRRRQLAKVALAVVILAGLAVTFWLLE